MTAYAEWVLGTSRGARRPRIVTEHWTRRPGPLLARNPWNTDSAAASPSPTSAGGRRRGPADRTEFLGRNGAPDRPAGAGPRRTGSGPRRRRPRPLRRAPDQRSSSRRASGPRSSSCSARREAPRGAPTWSGAAARPTATTALRAVAALLGRRRSARSRCGRRTGRWTSCSIAGCSTRRSPAGLGALGLLPGGRRVRLPRPAPGRDGARSRRAASWPGSTSCGPRRASSSRATCSTGGIRRRAAACARASPTIASGCPTSSRTTSRSTGDAAVLDEPVPFLEGPALRAGPGGRLLPAGPVAASRHRCSSTASRPIDRSLAVGAHGLPLMGTGDWNDGMNRVGREGRGESVWLGWFLHTVLAAFAPIAERRGERRARGQRWRAAHAARSERALERDGWDGDWYRRAYFDDGTPLGSAGERRVPDRLDRPVVGRHLRRRRSRPRGARRWRPSRSTSSGAATGSSCCSRRRSTTPTLDPGYIKGYLPGIRENGGQYTHAALWAVARVRRARRRRQGRRAVLRSSTRSTTPAPAPGSTATRSSRTSWPPTSTPSRRTSAAAAGPGTPARPAGCTGPASSGSSASGCAARRSLIDPCIPRAWPGFEIDFRYHSARYEIVVENPHGVSRGVASSGARRTDARGR